MDKQTCRITYREIQISEWTENYFVKTKGPKLVEGSQH